MPRSLPCSFGLVIMEDEGHKHPFGQAKQSSSNLLMFEAAGPVFEALVPPVRALITLRPRSGLHVNAIRFINGY